MGVDRALIAVALQSLFMRAVRDHGDHSAVAALEQRVLATAASLDYVLMLATETAGTSLPAGIASRAIHAGFARAVDDGLVLLAAIASTGNDEMAHAFAREGVHTLRAAVDAEALADDRRIFAFIALTNDLSR